MTRRLVERAEDSGYTVICLTVDVPRLAQRERDIRNRLQLPPHARPRNFEGLVSSSDATGFHEVMAGLFESSRQACIAS